MKKAEEWFKLIPDEKLRNECLNNIINQRSSPTYGSLYAALEDAVDFRLCDRVIDAALYHYTNL